MGLTRAVRRWRRGSILMECSEAKPHLSALALGSIGSGDEAELRTHVATCVECALELELLQGRSVPPPAPPEAESDQPLAVAPLAPPTSDWTVERIFGEGGVAQTAPPADAVSASAENSAPTQTSARPSMIFPTESPTPTPTEQEEKAPPTSSAAKTSRESWDFEPADAAREATPPEESLLFAEQALNRRIEDPTRKGAAIRAIFWVGSAVVGVGLLGVSLWMAMAVQQAPSREISARVKSSVPSGGVPATPTPSVEHEVRGSAPSAPTPDAEVPAPTPHPATGPAGSSAAAPPAAGVSVPAPIKSGLTMKSVAPTPSIAPKESKASAPKQIPPPVVKSGERVAASPSSKSASTSPPVKEAAPAAKSVPPVSATPAPIVPRDDDEMWPTDDPVHVSPAPVAVTKISAPPKQAAVAAPETPVPTPAPAAPAPPRVDMKPIDRLHAATEQAAKDQDLVALRQVKTTWKNLLRTVVGPDRSRVKRELADCLWYVQELSGREVEQRETLLAYRDYLLSAPAGGADPRSAARLRELEDALSERR